MASYKLNEKAADDLDRLFDYGIDHFGLRHAQAYVEGLKRRLDEIGAHPRRYRAVDEIREGYRRSVYRAHSIYYRIGDETVEIMRILGREDPEKQLFAGHR